MSEIVGIYRKLSEFIGGGIDGKSKKSQEYLRNSKKSSTFAWKNEKTVIVHSAICLYAGDGDGYRLPFVVAGGNEYAGRKGGRDGG